MDTNFQNIFTNPKSTTGTLTCGACFQEFTSYNDLVIHERMHIEQMSLASLSGHFIPQYDSRTTLLASTYQQALGKPQIDNQTANTASENLSVSSHLADTVKSPSVPHSLTPQLDLSRSSVYDSPVSANHDTESPAPNTESQIPQTAKTHIELKTPTYIAIPYNREYSAVKASERRRSLEEYDSRVTPQSITSNSPDVTALGGLCDDKTKTESATAYQIPGSAVDKHHSMAKTDFSVTGLIQPEPHTSLFDLTSLNKSFPIVSYENSLQKPQFDAIPFYYETFNLDGYDTNKQPTDYSIQTLSSSKLQTVSSPYVQTNVPTNVPSSTGVQVSVSKKTSAVPIAQHTTMSVQDLSSGKPFTVETVLPQNLSNYASVQTLSRKKTDAVPAVENLSVTDFSIQALSNNSKSVSNDIVPGRVPVYTSVQTASGRNTNTVSHTVLTDYNTQAMKKAVTTPALIPVLDYSKHTLFGNIDEANNVQYQVQMPVASIKQEPQFPYAVGTQQIPIPIQVIEMPLSNEYFKKQGELSSASQTVPHVVYSGLKSYVQTTLNCTPQFQNSNALKSGHFHVASQIPDYQVYGNLAQETEGQKEKSDPQSQYQFTAVPISNIASKPEYSEEMTVHFPAPVSVKATAVTISSKTSVQTTNALPEQVVVTSSSESKTKTSAVRLPDGTYYPNGLPLPHKKSSPDAKDLANKAKNSISNKSLEQEIVANKTIETEEEFSKQQEFIDMIKMVQQERSKKSKYMQLNDSSDSEKNESEEYKVDIACFICSKEFENQKTLFKHMHKHREVHELSSLEETDDDDGKRKIKKLCKYCGRQYMHLPQLIEHIRKHTAEKEFECRFCNRAYTNKIRCMKHETTHNKDELGMHCELCKKEVENKAFYLYHLNEHVIKEERKEEEEKQHKFAEMIRNLQSDTKNDKDKSETAEDQMLNLLLNFEKDKMRDSKANEESLSEIPEAWPCRICTDKILKKDFLQHFKSHKIYICEVCCRGFTRKLNFTYHSDTMHFKEEIKETGPVKKAFVCSICEKRLSKNSKLKLHLQTHVRDEPLLNCEICFEPFYNKGDYFYHLSKHNDNDAAKLIEAKKSEKENAQAKAKKGHKVSQLKVPKEDRVKQKNEANEKSNQRELRQKNKRKSDYSWHGLVEENLKAGFQNNHKRIGRNGVLETEKNSKRTRKQVDRYSEKLNEQASLQNNFRKRKLEHHDLEQNSRITDSEGTCNKVIRNDIKTPDEAETRLSELMKCKVCKKELSKLVYVEHFKSHFLLTCEECKRSFVKKNTFIAHFKNVHETEVAEEMVDKEFAKYQESKMHKQKEKHESKKVTDKSNEAQKVSDTNKREKISPRFKKTLLKPINPLEQELQKIKENSDSFMSKLEKQKLGYMYEKDTDKPFVCTGCNGRFMKQCGVVTHLKVHLNTEKNKRNTSSVPETNKSENTVHLVEESDINSQPVPKIMSYFCGICQKTIAQKHNFESHMKAKHKSEMFLNEPMLTEMKRNASSETTLQIRSPPKKRKIFVDGIFEQKTDISDISKTYLISESCMVNKAKQNPVEVQKRTLMSNYGNENAVLQSFEGQVTEVLPQTADKQTIGDDKYVDKVDTENLLTEIKNNVMLGKAGKSYPKFCPVCHQEQKSLRNYTEHLRSHTGQRPFQCELCSKTFSRERNLKAHEKKWHPKCGIVSKLNTTDTTNYHELNGRLDNNKIPLDAVPLQMNTEVRDNPMSKEIDSVTKYDIAEVGKPKLDLNNKLKDTVKPYQARDILKEIVKRNSAFKKCPICFMKIHTKEIFDKHLKSHSESTPFSCRSCDFSSETKEELFEHRKYHPPEKTLTGTNTESSLDDNAHHITTKHAKTINQKVTENLRGKNMYSDNYSVNPLDLVCKLCYANFMTKAAFDTHLQLHADEENDADDSSNGDDDENGSFVTDSWEQGDNVQSSYKDKNIESGERWGLSDHVDHAENQQITKGTNDSVNKKNELQENFDPYSMITQCEIEHTAENKMPGKGYLSVIEQQCRKSSVVTTEASAIFQNNIQSMFTKKLPANSDRICRQGAPHHNFTDKFLFDCQKVHNVMEGIVLNDEKNSLEYWKTPNTEVTEPDVPCEKLVHSWSECSTTLSVNETVSWKDKLQNDFLDGNASQHVRPDSIEYGCARNYDV